MQGGAHPHLAGLRVLLAADIRDDVPPFYAWFIKRNAAGARTHHIHMVEPSFSEHWARLQFRDYLIAHPEVAAEYARLNRSLATEHPDDRVAYTSGKGAFIPT